MKTRIAILLTLVLVALCATAAAFEWKNVDITAYYFPDETFRNYVGDHFNTTVDQTLTVAELQAVKKIDISNLGIGDLRGIEYFGNLEELSCDYNNLKTLNVNALENLTVLNCCNNQLTALNVVQNAKLKHLYCSYNQLTSLYVNRTGSKLIVLDCAVNKLTTLDVTKNTELVILDCNNNELKNALFVSNCPEITQLTCYDNQISTLNVSALTKLVYLSCSSNQLTSLNLGSNTELKGLTCSMNNLSFLGLTNNTKLFQLSCDSNNLTSLDLSGNPALEGLSCSDNQISQLDLTNKPKLQFLWCEANALSELDISECAASLNALVLDEQPVFNQEYQRLQWGGNNTMFPALRVKPGVKVYTTDGLYRLKVSSITLNKTKETVTRTAKKLKPTVQLKATAAPSVADNKAVTWQSSNTKVATVDQTGKVTALKAGTATITCTAKDGGGAKSACKITVKDKLVTKLTLNKKSATLKVKQALKLKAKVTPADAVNGKLKWTTSKKTVATVDQNGKVTAKKAGKCVITCATADGKKKAKCTITVK